MEVVPLVPTSPESPLAITLIGVDGKVVRLTAHVLATHAVCPACQTASDRIHDRYVRRPLDLPWRGSTVRFSLTVRRFRCRNRACPRRTFVEGAGADLPRSARRTAPATQALLAFALSDGGEGGARLARQVGLPVSPDTLLRLRRRHDSAPIRTPRVLGVDDFALRRGRRYAPLLVDLETRRPVDILEGREAQVLEAWLQRHEGVEVIVRDRADGDAQGARAGAPDAVQVADRFHLVQDATEALKEVLRGRPPVAPPPTSTEPEPSPAEEPAVADHNAAAEGTVSSAPPSPAPPILPSPNPNAARTAARQARSRGRWEQARARREGGQTISGIAREMQLSRMTVRRLLAAPFPRSAEPPVGQLYSSALQPHVPYLERRWAEGERNVSALYRGLKERGYRGSRPSLGRALRRWPRDKGRASSRPSPSCLSRRDRRWLCLSPPAGLTDRKRRQLAALLEADPELARGHDLAHRLREIVATGDVGGLNQWTGDARASGLAPFASLAHGLEADRAAVEMALRTGWSNGPTEGHVCRVKLLKRAGFGRAKVDLLRSRVRAA